MEVVAQDYALVELDALRPHPANPNVGDLAAIEESVEVNGFYGAVVAQRSTGRILVGEHRWRAAQEAGAAAIPVLRVDVDDERAVSIMVADNGTRRGATYHEPKLAAVLQSMGDENLRGTGWQQDDLRELLERLRRQETRPAGPEVVIEPPTAPRTRRGDIWVLGEHRLMCGDARAEEDVDKLLDGAQVHVAVTSPPYADRREYDDETEFKPVPPEEYVEWFEPVQRHVAARLADDGSWFVNIKAGAEGLDTHLYVLDLVIAHVREWGWHFATEFCWERGGFPQLPRRRFKNQFEPVYQFARGPWKFRPEAVRVPTDKAFQYEGTESNRVLEHNQGATGGDWFREREMSEGLAYPGNRLARMSGSHEALGHAAAYPVGLPEWFIKAYSDEGDAVFDPFVGSGSTLIACEQQGRRGYGMEISRGYVDVAVHRWEQSTGRKAKRARRRK